MLDFGSLRCWFWFDEFVGLWMVWLLVFAGLWLLLVCLVGYVVGFAVIVSGVGLFDRLSV